MRTYMANGRTRGETENMADISYRFINKNEDPIPRDEPIVTRLEGAIRGTILSEDVIIQTSE